MNGPSHPPRILGTPWTSTRLASELVARKLKGQGRPALFFKSGTDRGPRVFGYIARDGQAQRIVGVRLVDTDGEFLSALNEAKAFIDTERTDQ